jgi:Ser/Thr protein kinase RdoA (MazF antagonist)
MTKQISDIASLLDTASPALTRDEVDGIARDVFGLTARISELAGERDRNYHLQVGDEHYVLKVSNPAESREVIDFQTRALLHIAQVDPILPVPRLVPTRTGAAEWVLALGKATPRIVRVLTFVQGLPLHRVSASAALRRNFGAEAARLDLAMRGFFHPAAGHELMWDLKHATRVRDLLDHIQDEARRALAQNYLDAFEAHALPKLPRLRAQVIHNDLNPHNVLVSPDDHSRIAGIIDFGDMVHAPLINNLAVAAAYQLRSGRHPLETAAEIVASYHRVLPLEREEIDILFDLIMTRMVLTVAIAGWRAARYPENATYILRNSPQAWEGLARCSELSRTDAQIYLRQACQTERSV